MKRQPAWWPLVLSYLIVLSFPIVATSGEDTDAAAYLGPAPGVRFFYEADNGQKIEIRGLTYAQDGALLIEKKLIFPKRSIDFTAGCTTEVTTIHALSASGNTILKKSFPLNGMTKYHTDLDLVEHAWGEDVVLTKSGSSYAIGQEKKTASQCSITKRSKQKLFGKERTVIEVSGQYCVPRKYASGIGIIDYAGFKLVRIEKRGEVVFTLR